MTSQEVHAYYRGGYSFMKKTKMAFDTYKRWMENGYIPINSQIKLEKLTKGALKADLKHIPKV